MSRLAYVLLLLFATLCVWTCDLSDAKKGDTLTFHVDDSLKASAGKYDSIRLDLYSIAGTDTAYAKAVFHGAYADPTQLENLPLGDAPARFMIKIIGYRKGEVAFASGVPFGGGKQAGPAIVYKPADLLANRPPTIALQPPPSADGIRIKEGDTVSFGLRIQDPDARDKTSLLPLIAPAACGASIDVVAGRVRLRPSLQCVSGGDSAIDSIIIRAADDANPPDTARLAIRIDIADSNSAPRWSASARDLSGKEGKPIEFDFASLLLGDAEKDSISIEATCGAADRKTGMWTFTPGYRDAGKLDCDLVASDSHVPPARSMLTLHLAIADSVRLVDVAIVSPPRGFVTKDSLVPVQWNIGDAAQTKDTTERLKTEGVNWIKRSFRDSLGNSGSDSVEVILDTKPPAKPSVRIASASPTNNPKPKWTWSSGGNGGNGIFQYKLDDSNFVSGASAPIPDTLFIPANNLGEGTHTLYVRERDAAGNWSAVGAASTLIDLAAPGAPKIDSTPYSPVNSLKPVWTWSSGGNGNGTYRFQIDNADLASGITIIGTSYSPSSNLTEGRHKFYVQEMDEAGNWSAFSAREIICSPAMILGSRGVPYDNSFLRDFALSQEGVPYFLFTNSAGGEEVMNFQGNSWGFVGSQLSSVLPLRCHVLSLSISKSGIPMVAYNREDSSGAAVGAGILRFENGGWTFDSNAEIPGWVYPTSLAINGQQQPMLATLDGRDAGRNTGISVFRMESGNWVSLGGARFTSSSVQPRDIKLKLDDAGNPYVSFIDENNDRVSVMRFNSATNHWDYVGLPNILNRTVLRNQLAIGGSGALYLAVDGSPAGYPTILHYDGAAWQVVGTEKIVHSSDHFSLSLSKTERPYLGFTDFNSGKAMVVSFREGKWTPLRTTGVVPGLNSGAANVYLAIADEIPYVALNDGERGNGITVTRTSFEP